MNKQFQSYEIVKDGVIARFTDGTEVHGTYLVGCEGGGSAGGADLTIRQSKYANLDWQFELNYAVGRAIHLLFQSNP